MNCRRARHLLFDFVDGLGNESARAELDRHLGQCPPCERFAAEMTRALSLVRHAPVESLDENFNWKVRLAIHRERNATRARAASAGAWVRSWNLRYALSTGLALGAVLVAGAVILPRVQGLDAPVTTAVRETAGTPSLASGVQGARPQAQSPVRSLVPRESAPAPWQSSAGRLVSLGDGGRADGTASPGAIDPDLAGAQVDSLIAENLERMTPEERSRYLLRRIVQLQSHLQSQQNGPPQR